MSDADEDWDVGRFGSGEGSHRGLQERPEDRSTPDGLACSVLGHYPFPEESRRRVLDLWSESHPDPPSLLVSTWDGLSGVGGQWETGCDEGCGDGSRVFRTGHRGGVCRGVLVKVNPNSTMDVESFDCRHEGWGCPRPSGLLLSYSRLPWGTGSGWVGSWEVLR